MRLTLNWFERRRKRRLLGYKNLKINGMRFTIRRVNPFMDFPGEKIPQLFTEIVSSRKTDPTKPPTTEQINSVRDVMLSFIKAGVVEPRLVPIGIGDKNGKEDGLTAEDLCRDHDMGLRLYWAILTHSLNAFKGVKGLFFSIKQRLSLFTLLRVDTVWNQWMSLRPIQNPPLMNDNASIFSSQESLSKKKNVNGMMPSETLVGGDNG